MLQRHFVAELPTNTLKLVEAITTGCLSPSGINSTISDICHWVIQWQFVCRSSKIWDTRKYKRPLPCWCPKEDCLKEPFFQNSEVLSDNCFDKYRLDYIYNISTNLWTSRMMPGFGQDWISKPRINNSVDSSDKSRISFVRFSSIPYKI